MSIKMTEVHPNTSDTYQIGFDDGCLVVASGSDKDAPKVWLSKPMLQFLEVSQFSENGKVGKKDIRRGR